MSKLIRYGGLDIHVNADGQILNPDVIEKNFGIKLDTIPTIDGLIASTDIPAVRSFMTGVKREFEKRDPIIVIETPQPDYRRIAYKLTAINRIIMLLIVIWVVYIVLMVVRRPELSSRMGMRRT